MSDDHRPGAGEAAQTSDKAPPPELFARAPRPPVVRIRRGAALAVGIAAAAVMAAALTWAFVVQPELRALARAKPDRAETAEARGTVRPSEMVSGQPASYDRLDRGALPPPRSLHPEPPSQPPRTSRMTPPSPAARAAEARRARIDEARGSDLMFAGRDQAPAPSPPANPGAPAPGDLTPLASPFTLLAGSIVPAALLSAVDTARPGPVVASITADVYDTVSGRHLLIPQGARLIGRQETGSRHGETRAFLVWSRLILPNGSSLSLDAAPAVDAEGAVGAPGRVQRRLGPLALAALAAGAITTLGQAARDHEDGRGLLLDAGDAAAIEAAQVGGRLVDRELAVAPSVRLAPGAPVLALITTDLVLEPLPPMTPPLALAGLAASAVAAALASMGPDALVINESPSLPRGLYVRDRDARPFRGAVVAAVPPPAGRAYLAGLGAPPDARVLKRVVAVAGDRVCAAPGQVTAARRTLVVLSRDRRGAGLPVWRGCRRLAPGELFLAGDTPTSFDSRYFGPVRLTAVGGVYRRLW